MRYGKGIINIYEFQQPGTHGLKDENTYYNAGFEAAVQNFCGLIKAYPESEMTMAAHHYYELKLLLD